MESFTGLMRDMQQLVASLVLAKPRI